MENPTLSCTETYDMGFSYREFIIPVKGENELNEITGDKQLSKIYGTEEPEELGDEEERC